MLWHLVSNLQMTKTKPCKCPPHNLSDEKIFEIIVYSIEQLAPKPLARCKCLQVDLQKVSDILTSFNSSSQNSNIKDWFYLGKYLTIQVVSKAKTTIGQTFKIY